MITFPVYYAHRWDLLTIYSYNHIVISLLYKTPIELQCNYFLNCTLNCNCTVASQRRYEIINISRDFFIPMHVIVGVSPYCCCAKAKKIAGSPRDLYLKCYSFDRWSQPYHFCSGIQRDHLWKSPSKFTMQGTMYMDMGIKVMTQHFCSSTW